MFQLEIFIQIFEIVHLLSMILEKEVSLDLELVNSILVVLINEPKILITENIKLVLLYSTLLHHIVILLLQKVRLNIHQIDCTYTIIANHIIRIPVTIVNKSTTNYLLNPIIATIINLDLLPIQ